MSDPSIEVGITQQYLKSLRTDLADMSPKEVNNLLLNSTLEDDDRMVMSCIANGADVNHRNLKYGNVTALQAATIRGQEVLAGRLLALKANPNKCDGVGATALHHAAAVGHTDLIRALVDAGSQVNAQTTVGCSPLHLACKEAKESAVVALLQGNVEIDLEDLAGATALHYAAAYGNTIACKLLLEAGASLRIEDRDRRTAQERAAKRGHDDLAMALADVRQSQQEGDDKAEEAAIEELQRLADAGKENPASFGGPLQSRGANDDSISHSQ
mmetsp:Transcript_33572/g.52238  ORF Transcript_33572/g.52238 Transcript_33572/m.52238 type:complete len:271 (-) Transcript_33572:40-852(-)